MTQGEERQRIQIHQSNPYGAHGNIILDVPIVGQPTVEFVPLTVRTVRVAYFIKLVLDMPKDRYAGIAHAKQLADEQYDDFLQLIGQGTTHIQGVPTRKVFLFPGTIVHNEPEGKYYVAGISYASGGYGLNPGWVGGLLGIAGNEELDARYYLAVICQ